MDDRILAEKIAQSVADAGGTVYYVGGCVRDSLMGQESKDVDIEVHGIPQQALEEILDTFGRRKEVGKSFGIYMLEHHTLDIALPRRERPTGKGHRDFLVEVDPFISTLDAARRRDFTVNALMQNVLSGEVIDHFGGKEDLGRKTLRHVDAHTFVEDPLRVLRAAQFTARFEFSVAPETIALCKGISLANLSAERVMEETKKTLLFARKPSLFFTFLRECGQLKVWFEELYSLIGVPQNPKYHAEGDVWNHTMMVLDAAAELRERAKHPFYFMLSALLHDVGKAVSTVEINGVLHSYNHEKEGIPLIENALRRLTKESRLRQYVVNMTLLHMRPRTLAAQDSSSRATNRLFDRSLCPEDLLLLARADDNGRLQAQKGADYMPFLEKRLKEYKELMRREQVRGEDLIAAGLTPNEHFKDLVAYAHKLHLSGVDKESALKQTLAYQKELIK